MHAYVHTEFGGPDVLSMVEVPTPVPQENEVLIQVRATTVSAGDWRARSLTVPAGMGWMARLFFGIRRPRNPILGTELSGTVVQVGARVDTFQVGDAVIGFPGAKFGAHAEYIAMPADGPVVYKPANLTDAEAAAMPFGATTAYDFLINKGKLRAGEHVLINGASGAVGSACVQIAKHFGAEVTAVCSAKNTDLVRRLGADHVIDYTVEDFARQDQKYDVVVDTVGTAPWTRTRHALARNGRMLMISGNLTDMVFGDVKARLRSKRLIAGVASESVDVLRAVVDLAAAGHFRPVIDRNYDFSQMPTAHAHVDSGHKVGSVVVTVSSNEVASQI